MKLKDIAKVIRSKNAGPFWVTLDIMLPDAETYRNVKATGVLNADLIARLYGMTPDKVRFFEYDPAYSFKATIPRRVFSGDFGDTDSYGAQQHAPLLDVEIPL
ncbi:MAG: DUF4387 domain-containing protein [Clostridia bacterium]|nr:DUF4387 domain-containing protein [Clostridia bacterium]